MHVRWGRANQNGQEGVKVMFVFDEVYVDEFEFFEKPDVDCMLELLTRPTMVPELLLMVIRDRLNITVH